VTLSRKKQNTAKYGKMRPVNAVNGSQMVVKIGVVYYRRVRGRTEINWNLLLGSDKTRTFFPDDSDGNKSAFFKNPL
jgi:hypothetical protein